MNILKNFKSKTNKLEEVLEKELNLGNRSTMHFSNKLSEKEEKSFLQVYADEFNQQIDFIKISRVSNKKNLIPSF